MDEEYLEPEEEQALDMDYGDMALGYPRRQERVSPIVFIDKVRKTRDSTKVSYMNDEEVAALRSLHNGSLYAEVFNLNLVSNYLMSKAENIAAPTLGRDGNLLNAAITTKREFQARLKSQKKNKGWFKPKKKQQEGMG